MQRYLFVLLFISAALSQRAVLPIQANPAQMPQAQATAQEASHQRIGVHMHPAWDTSDRTRLDAASAIGANIIRIGVSWRLLEPQPGQWDTDWYLPQLDMLLSNAQQRGLQVFFMVAETPCWASSATEKDCSNPDSNPDAYKWYPPTSNTDYAAALSFLVEHYDEQVQAWELWNEPNFPRFWGNAPDASAYTALLQAGYRAIKSSNPSAVVLGGSLAGADTAYLTDMYVAGARGFFDALALHPYSGVLAPDDCSNLRWSYGCGVEQIRQTMLDAGDDLPIWFTEFGWSSLDGSGGVGEESQADYLQQAATMLNQWDYVSVAIWYNLVNTGDAASGDREDYYGLFRHDLSPKPAADRFRDLTAAPSASPSAPPPAATNTDNAPAASNGTFADNAFEQVWARTDRPLTEGAAGLQARTWIWGPEPITAAHYEQYREGANGTRLVQYFDKSRMEINDPATGEVTNGLLVMEMIEGRIQVGNEQFEERAPSNQAVAGDPTEVNEQAPTYRSLRHVAFPVKKDHFPNRNGQSVTEVLASDGSVTKNESLAGYNVTFAAYDEQLGHNIPNVFTDYFAQQGIIYEQGSYRQGQIIDWLFAIGLPISEPYWAKVRVNGVEKDVLLQAFQRRVLTYTPTNSPSWRVEMGNVGQHYLRWRYGQ